MKIATKPIVKKPSSVPALVPDIKMEAEINIETPAPDMTPISEVLLDVLMRPQTAPMVTVEPPDVNVNIQMIDEWDVEVTEYNNRGRIKRLKLRGRASGVE